MAAAQRTAGGTDEAEHNSSVAKTTQDIDIKLLQLCSLKKLSCLLLAELTAETCKLPLVK